MRSFRRCKASFARVRSRNAALASAGSRIRLENMKVVRSAHQFAHAQCRVLTESDPCTGLVPGRTSAHPSRAYPESRHFARDLHSSSCSISGREIQGYLKDRASGRKAIKMAVADT